MKLTYISTFVLMSLLYTFAACRSYQPIASNASLDNYPVYNGKDLGLTYTSKKSVFNVWLPTASHAKIKLYKDGIGGKPLLEKDLKPTQNGVWQVIIEGDQKGKYYTFQVEVGGKTLAEVPDPYAKAVGVNGIRAQIVNLPETNPKGWETDRRVQPKSPTDIVLYELHLRDISVHQSSNIQHRGKYLGLVELNTKNPTGESTGLDHLAELGVTHIHILPAFDNRSIDETNLNQPQYNWGYDPLNYNVPEGSYATDPYNGEVRIREFKQMVQALHQKGLGVILDVVYNHTGLTEDSYFEQLVPGYYYRKTSDGKFSNASACGNETASERAMVRKMIVESVKYWVEEYHIDGFRFDLMGIHDQETMDAVRAALDEIDPAIFVYGEGWTAGDSPLPVEKRALKQYTYKMNRIAAFSDDLRDGLKGSVFIHDQRGFATGAFGMEESIKFGIVGATQHPQVDYQKVNYSKSYWAGNAEQCINYVSCHDNHTLRDRIEISNPEADEATRLAMERLCNAIVLTSQGVPFLHNGVEFSRTKQKVENSYNSPDPINWIDWNAKHQYKDTYQYYRDLLRLRREHPAFRLNKTDDIVRHLHFLDINQSGVVGYTLSDNANGDSWREILVVFNAKQGDVKFNIPQGDWHVVFDNKGYDPNGTHHFTGNSVSMPSISTLILIQK